MKIISLNTWMGTVFEPLMAFVEAQASSTDVFCFQEMLGALEEGKEVLSPEGRRVNLFQELQKRLPDFEARDARYRGDLEMDVSVNGPSWFGVATFVRKGIVIEGAQPLAFGEETHPRTGIAMDYGGLRVQLSVDGRPVTLCNLHGIAFPDHKLDSPKRLVQSRIILDAANDASGEVVIMGDFNLFPDTESIRMFEKAGFRNLITEFDVQTTRGTLHKKLHPEWGKPPFEWQEYADFMFVSPGVKVTSFEVPDEPISDHLSMILECEL